MSLGDKTTRTGETRRTMGIEMITRTLRTRTTLILTRLPTRTTTSSTLVVSRPPRRRYDKDEDDKDNKDDEDKEPDLPPEPTPAQRRRANKVVAQETARNKTFSNSKGKAGAKPTAASKPGKKGKELGALPEASKSSGRRHKEAKGNSDKDESQDEDNKQRVTKRPVIESSPEPKPVESTVLQVNAREHKVNRKGKRKQLSPMVDTDKDAKKEELEPPRWRRPPVKVRQTQQDNHKDEELPPLPPCITHNLSSAKHTRLMDEPQVGPSKSAIEAVHTTQINSEQLVNTGKAKAVGVIKIKRPPQHSSCKLRPLYRRKDTCGCMTFHCGRSATWNRPTHPRNVQCRLVQFLTGHGFYGADSARFHPHIDPQCLCGKPLQTPKHLLMFCPDTEEYRRIITEISPERSWEEIFGTLPGLEAVSEFILKSGIGKCRDPPATPRDVSSRKVHRQDGHRPKTRRPVGSRSNHVVYTPLRPPFHSRPYGLYPELGLKPPVCRHPHAKSRDITQIMSANTRTQPSPTILGTSIHPNIAALMSFNPSAVIDRLDRIDANTAEILQNHAGLQANLTDHQEQVRQSFTSQSHQILGLNSSLESSQANINRLSTDIDNLSRKVEGVSRKVDRVETGIQELRTQMGQILDVLSTFRQRELSKPSESKDYRSTDPPLTLVPNNRAVSAQLLNVGPAFETTQGSHSRRIGFSFSPITSQVASQSALFLVYFPFWRLAYDADLGWVLTKQSKRRWIVKQVQVQGWLDNERRSKVYEWIRNELRNKMVINYSFDELPVEYNTWILFRQVVDIILINDFLSYCIFAFTVFRVPDGLSLSSHALRYVSDRSIGARCSHRGRLVPSPSPDSSGTVFDTSLGFDGVFEMAAHPVYSVGYAGYYGLSLIAGSYALFFVSLWAHAMQFGFLVWFDNPCKHPLFSYSD
ncbi:phosphatidylethanolamine N-methyltransferase [Rhizoctonia solani AG-1 IA]|uniref:Phosphatidylethanolamine N-methyltransferase n=1 Tax=Thanatephorus cucumeris (strain AG1-IA) TaxID=983506 RepID=L8X2H1_THACA|nr:phosphatidylethanolamine N-methyltransferase [Rhizoctonia solani AG-1 IA]